MVVYIFICIGIVYVLGICLNFEKVLTNFDWPRDEKETGGNNGWLVEQAIVQEFRQGDSMRQR